MTLVQLQVLLAITDAGSFTAAASQLGMTQSAVSRALASLEQELKARLIERGRGGPRLTAIGERVALHARVALAAAEAARQEAIVDDRRVVGRVRLGSFPNMSSRIMPQVLRLFRERYPDVTIVLLEGTDEEVHDWIVEGIVDVGFVTEPSTGLHTVPLLDNPFVAVMAHDDPLARQAFLTAQNLAAVALILPTSGCERLVASFFQRSGAPLCPSYRVRDTSTILAMVREGLGVCVLSMLSIPEPATGLRLVPLEPAVVEQICFGVRARAPMSPAVHMLINETIRLLKRDEAPAGSAGP